MQEWRRTWLPFERPWQLLGPTRMPRTLRLPRSLSSASRGWAVMWTLVVTTLRTRWMTGWPLTPQTPTLPLPLPHPPSASTGAPKDPTSGWSRTVVSSLRA